LFYRKPDLFFGALVQHLIISCLAKLSCQFLLRFEEVLLIVQKFICICLGSSVARFYNKLVQEKRENTAFFHNVFTGKIFSVKYQIHTVSSDFLFEHQLL